MKKIFKVTCTVFLAVVVLLLLYTNFRLGYAPDYQTSAHGAWNTDVVDQLHFLKQELHDNRAGEKMQQLYPEGFLFIHALYALTWYDVAKTLKPDSPPYKEALQEMDWVLRRIQSTEGTAIFDPSLEIEYGAFYTGWTNLVLGRKLLLLPPEKRNSVDIQRFQLRCVNIAEFIADSGTPFASSYGNAAWPADMVMCLTSLAMHDRLFAPRYQKIVSRWLVKVRQRLDTATCLIPHYVDAPKGYALDGARGSSQSLMQCFLPEIDSAFASEQFAHYRKWFLDNRLGLPGIREYPHGNFGIGDVDSGPVIWGIGGAASIVGQRALAIHGDAETAIGLRNSIEGFGIGLTWNGRKRYLFGVLPMADAFIAWANAAPLTNEPMLPGWRRYFLVYSTLVALAIYGLLYWMWRRKGV